MTLWMEPRQAPPRLAALLVFAMGTFPACTTLYEPGGDTASWYVPSDPGWTACEDRLATGMSNIECASLRVPVDWADGTGPTLDLELARIPAADPARRVGAVIVLSGGPGGSGIDDLPLVASLLPEVGERFDLVAHRPRTVIEPGSIPKACLRRPDSVVDLPRDSLEYARMLAPIAEAVARCRAADSTGLLDHLDGRSQALDVEAIRRALGEERVSLTAQSYGGVVVAAYARMFPERVRAAYLDGVASHPDFPFPRGPRSQLDRFEAFIDWCGKDPRCALHGEDVRQAWLDLTAAATRSPIPARSERFGTQRMSGAQLHFLKPRWGERGEGDANWVALAGDIDRARKGDASAFLDWAYGNLTGWSIPLELALLCPDGAQGLRGFGHFQARLEPYRAANPLLYGTKLLGLPCGAWPLELANPPAPLPACRLPPFLGAGTLDNDFESTQQLLEHVPGSVTIGVPGSGHVVYLGGASEEARRCVARHISRYLIDLRLPGEGALCPA